MAVKNNELISTETEQLLSEIATLGILINTRTSYCAFVDFAGHVDGVTVRIAKSKKEFGERLAQKDLYHVSDNTDALRRLRESLTEILESGNVRL